MTQCPKRAAGPTGEVTIQHSAFWRSPLALALAAAFLALATACATIATPRGWSGPVPADGVILVSYKGELRALEDRDGALALRWRFPDDKRFPEDKGLDLEGIYGNPIVVNGTVYFGGYDGDVYALDLETGRPRWPRPFETDGPMVAGLALAEGLLLAGSDDEKLYLLVPETGDLKGSCKVDGGIWATPLVADGVVYVASLGGKLYAFDFAYLATGGCQQRWKEPFETDGGLISTPVLADGTILVGGIDRRLYAIEVTTGAERWSFKADDWFWTRPLVEGGIVYAGNLDGNVYALDLASGEPVWDQPFETEAPIRAAAILLGGVLVVADREGNVYGLDPASGQMRWGAPAPLGSGVLGDPIQTAQGILVSTKDGLLFRIDPQAGAFQQVLVQP